MRLTLFPPGADRATRIVYLGVVIFILFVITLLVWPVLPVGGPFGSLAAQREVSRGQLGYALPMWDYGWEKEWRNLLENTYGIHVHTRVHSCLVGDFQATYDAAYNRIQLAAIRQAYGFDVIAITREKVRREWMAWAEAALPPADSSGLAPALSPAQLAALFMEPASSPVPIGIP